MLPFTENIVLNILTITFILFVVVYLFIKYKHSYWKKLGVPYLEPNFPYGNFEETIKAKRSVGEILQDQYNEMKAKGYKYFGGYFFHDPVLVAVDPDFIKTVMAKDFAYFCDRGIYYDAESDPLSASLFSLDGQKWKQLRAKLTPTFTSGKMKKMFQTLVDSSNELKSCLNEPIKKGEAIDIKMISTLYTTDVIGTCAFGIDCNSFKNPDTEFLRYGKQVFTPETWERLKIIFSSMFPKLTRILRLKLIDKNVDKFYMKLIKDTVKYREKNNIHRNDFMQLLIQLKNKGNVEDDEHEQENKDNTKLTMNELSAQAFLFFVAGYETSSSAITWSLLELSQNQEIQNTLREEIVRVLKKHNGQITYDSIMEMHYMDCVIYEAMRKYPALMFLQRVVTADYTIPNKNIVLKKGMLVFIPTFALHKDPEYYPNPDKFDPDRFLEQNKATRPDYTFLPFGEGPRICIGLRFGMMQVKVGLTQLLLNYKFTLNEKTVNPPQFDAVSFVSCAVDPILLNAHRV